MTGDPGRVWLLTEFFVRITGPHKCSVVMSQASGILPQRHTVSLWGLKGGDRLTEEVEAVPEPWVLCGEVCVSHAC